MSIACKGVSLCSLESNVSGKVNCANLKEQFNNICKKLISGY